jgi:hypothetical protein
MDKKDFVINIVENKVIKFQDFDIEIAPYIPQDVKLILAENYINCLSLSDNPTVGYYVAEGNLISGILQYCSNVNCDDNNLEVILSSGLWDEIKKLIINYNELRNDIRAILSQRNIEGSFNKIADKIMTLIDNISNMDMSKEGIEKLVGQLNSTVGDFQEKFPTSVVGTPIKADMSSPVTKPRKKRTPKVSE